MKSGLNDEIQINYLPIKRVNIIDCTLLPLEDLADRVQAIIQLGQPAFLNWAEGIVFFYIPLSPNTDGLIDKYLEGEIFIQDIIYAPMSIYRPTIKNKLYNVPVLNQTPNKVLREIAKWLKEYPEKAGNT